MPSPLDASPYDVLGVDPGVDDEELKRAYRRRLRQTHPDTGGSAAEFRLVQQAWDLVGTPEARAVFDHRRGAIDSDSPYDGERSSGDGWSATHTAHERRDTRPRARAYGHPGGWRRERYLTLIREFAGRGVPLDDPYDAALVRSAPYEIRHALADALAEEATARALAELGIGYTVWHDVLAPDATERHPAKIDHIVLGPTGLFAVQSEDYGVPVELRRGELVAGRAVTDPRERERVEGEPLHDLSGRARKLGRILGVRFAGAIVTMPDAALDDPWLDAGRSRGVAIMVVQRSVLAHLLRSGVPGVLRAQGVDLFEVRTRLQQGVRFI